MATYGTQKVFGGTRYQRFFNPKVKNTANEFGLYQWSTFRAYYAEVDAGTGIIMLASNPAKPALLFLSDFPALVRAGGLSTVVGSSVLYTVVENTLSTGLTATPSGSAVTLEAYGQVASGYTKGNSVFCTGFPVLTPTFPSAVPPPQYFLEATANSPVICSPVGGPPAGTFGFNGTPVGKGVSPIILRDLDYTDAIKKNDNVIVSTNNVEDVAYVVVGLWITPSLP
jgi:hypothetical protein